MELSPLTKYVTYQLYHAIAAVPKIECGGDITPLHQFRVALRRVRALFKLYPDQALPFPEPLKQFLKQTNPLRELDVLILSITEKHYPKAYRVLNSLRNDHYINLITETRKTEILQLLNQLYAEYLVLNPSVESEKLLLSPLDYYEKSLEAYRALKTDTPEKELHAVRIRFKVSRYSLEFLAESSLYHDVEMIRECKEIQDRLGAIQDTANQIIWLKTLLKDHPIKEFKVLLRERKRWLKNFKASNQ